MRIRVRVATIMRAHLNDHEEWLMKGRYLLLTAACALLLGGQPVLAAHHSDPLLSEARQAAKALGGRLKGEVMKSMKAKGPVGTIDFCSRRAPEIAREVSQQTGWEVGRTSLKYRNPANRPDDWERQVLESFEARKAAGEPVKTLEHGEVVELDGRKYYRYMKAIPTGKPCLNCHGAEVKPGVEQALKRLYPEDRARGFKLGDIRGAFTLRKAL